MARLFDCRCHVAARFQSKFQYTGVPLKLIKKHDLVNYICPFLEFVREGAILVQSLINRKLSTLRYSLSEIDFEFERTRNFSLKRWLWIRTGFLHTCMIFRNESIEKMRSRTRWRAFARSKSRLTRAFPSLQRAWRIRIYTLHSASETATWFSFQTIRRSVGARFFRERTYIATVYVRRIRNI